MKLRYINSIVVSFGLLMATGCNDNSWNDTYLDGFEGGATYPNTVTVSYTLTKADYESIGGTLYNLATTDEEKAAANSIRNNYYFDQSGPYPVEVAVPYLLNKEKTDFYIYNVGSKVQVSLAVAEGVPEEISKISASPRVTFQSKPTQSEVASKLSQKYPSAEAGDFVRVAYNNTANNAAATSTYKANSKGKFIYNPTVSSRAAEAVWSVSEALAKMADGYRGDAVVKGVVSEITELSTQYGNATYYIKDNASASESLLVYRGYNYGGEKFTSADQLVVGQEVIVSGSLVEYNGTLEFTSGNKLITADEAPGGDGNTGGGNTGGGNTGGGNTGGGNTGGGQTPGAGMNTLTSNIKNLSAGMELSATAMVTAVSTHGVVFSDNGGSIYYNNTAVDVNDYPVGTVARIKGTVSEENSSFQLTSSASILVVGEGSYIYPTPQKYTGSMINQAVASGNMVDPTYVNVEGTITKSSNSATIAVEGADAKIIFYPTAEILNKIENGNYYSVNGYYINTSGATDKYFNMVVTEVTEKPYPIDDINSTTVLYTFDGTNWTLAGNATVMKGAAYGEMGFEMNNLSNPKDYLPNYMKQAFPYALKDTEMFVAYNQTDTGCACSLLLFDGSEWTVNDNYLADKVAEFAKTDNGYLFRKYIGEEVFYLFDQDEIAMNCGYLFVWGNYCANPVDNGSRNYGYLYTTDIEINEENHSIIMPSGYNTFTFVTETEYNGNVYTAPEGMFMIVDSEGRFMSCGEEQYYTFYIRSDNAYINSDGTISAEYLFWATKNEDGSWKINCEYDRNGVHIERSIYYAESASYKNFAVYTPSQAASHTAFYPMLYISEETMPSQDNAANNE